MNACRQCQYFRRESESWELDHIRWYECKKRPSAANLKSFPFRNTKCSDFTQKPPHPIPLSMLSDD